MGNNIKSKYEQNFCLLDTTGCSKKKDQKYWAITQLKNAF